MNPGIVAHEALEQALVSHQTGRPLRVNPARP
jgi:hypothetical protein